MPEVIVGTPASQVNPTTLVVPASVHKSALAEYQAELDIAEEYIKASFQANEVWLLTAISFVLGVIAGSFIF